ncbi:MAG: hypothetical protein QM635_09950, partial [Microbacteriaceae bacterium]
LPPLGERLGLPVTLAPLGTGEDGGPGATGPRAAEAGAAGAPELVASTLPGGAEHALHFPERLRRESVFFEVAYDPWPSLLAANWLEAGGRVVDGLDMLVEQALVQVRIFVAGDPDTVLPDEAEVLAAMRAAVARPVGGSTSCSVG